MTPTHVRSLDVPSFSHVLRTLVGETGWLAFDARQADARVHRYSWAALHPVREMVFSGAFVTRANHTTIDSPREALSRFVSDNVDHVTDPYATISPGLFGYLTFEGLRAYLGYAPAKGFSRVPQCRFGRFATVVVFDHAEGTTVLRSFANPEEEERFGTALEAATEGPSMVPVFMRDAEGRNGSQNGVWATADREAQMWCRSEVTDRLHVARRSSVAATGERELDLALGLGNFAQGPRVIISHDSATLAGEVSGTRFVGTFSEAVNETLLGTTAGSPLDAAMTFIERHETVHRGLYGGVVMRQEGRRWQLHTIGEAALLADGAIEHTTGNDVRGG